MSSYLILGSSCKPQTIACASNHKFLPPKDSLYNKFCTQMHTYPVISAPETLFLKNIPTNIVHPEMVKSYYNKSFGDTESTSHYNYHRKKDRQPNVFGKCQGC